MILFGFLIAHLVICVVITFISWITHKSGIGYIIPIMWLIPGIGIVLYFAELYVENRVTESKRGYNDTGDNSHEIDSLEIESDQDSNIIVPLEEALVEGNEQIRRKLMFELLDAKGSSNIRLLQKLTCAEDMEIAHFASTTLMEYRRSHEQEIAETGEKIKENPSDKESLEQYCVQIEEYLQSGVLPPTVQGTYRDELKKTYERLVEIDPSSMDHREMYVKALMKTEKDDKEGKIKHVVEDTVKSFPADMRAYQLAAEYSYSQRSRVGIDEILEIVDEHHVYLNKSGRKWYSFWKGEAK